MVLLLGSCWHFFGIFFVSLLNVVFDSFFFHFGRVWEAKIRPKIDFLRGFWDAFLALSFWSIFLLHFDVIFNAQLVEISDFT